MRRPVELLLVWAAVWVLVCGSGARVEAANALSEATSRAFDADPKAFVRHMESYVGTVVARRFHVQEYLPKARDRQRYARTKAALLETQTETSTTAGFTPQRAFVSSFRSTNSSGELKMLGFGTYGSVFKAKDLTQPNKPDVAIKLVGDFSKHLPYVESDHAKHTEKVREERNKQFKPPGDHFSVTRSIKTEFNVYMKLVKGAKVPENVVEFKGLIVAYTPDDYDPEEFVTLDVSRLEAEGTEVGTSGSECLVMDRARIKAIATDCIRGLWMEICPYGDITAAVEKGFYGPPGMLRFFTQALNGVRYFHQHQMTHNDLKPANILLCNQGSRMAAKVADFGAVVDDSARLPSFDSVIGILNAPTGTAGFHPPEVLNWTPKVGLGDVFDMGLVGAEMLGNYAISQQSHNQCAKWTKAVYKVFVEFQTQQVMTRRDPAAYAKLDPKDRMKPRDVDTRCKEHYKTNVKDCEATRPDLLAKQLDVPALNQLKWKESVAKLIAKMQTCDVWLAGDRARPTANQAYQELQAIVSGHRIPDAPAAHSVADVDADGVEIIDDADIYSVHSLRPTQPQPAAHRPGPPPIPTALRGGPPPLPRPAPKVTRSMSAVAAEQQLNRVRGGVAVGGALKATRSR